MPTSKPIKNYIRGDSRLINVRVFQSDGKTPQNLAGCTVYFTVNTSKTPLNDGTDATAIIKKSTNVYADPSLGIATITLTNADTQPLAAGTYYYDVQIKDQSGNISSLPSNTFTVIDDIGTRIT